MAKFVCFDIEIIVFVANLVIKKMFFFKRVAFFFGVIDKKNVAIYSSLLISV
jgi:hypothetical protein